jgi:hypothetical protein
MATVTATAIMLRLLLKNHQQRIRTSTRFAVPADFVSFAQYHGVVSIRFSTNSTHMKRRMT